MATLDVADITDMVQPHYEKGKLEGKLESAQNMLEKGYTMEDILEITGLTLTPDRRTLFINTQHPGNGDPSKTNFPAAPDGKTIPRDCTFVITRMDGGIIGS